MMVSSGLLGSINFSSIFPFLFLGLNNLNWLTWKFTDSSANSICCWVLLVNFSFQLFCFSTPKFLFRSSYNFCLFIDILCSLSCYSQTSFNSFDIVSFSSLKIFIRAVLKSLSSSPNIWASSRTISINYFFPCGWAIVLWSFVVLFHFCFVCLIILIEKKTFTKI